MPNGIAYLMLLAWPVICVILFRRQSVERALLWSILGGYLFLPPRAEFNLPLVPAMDKVSIPNLSVLAILFFDKRHRLQLWPQHWLARILVLGLVLSAIPTVLTNRDPILFQVLRDADPIVFLIDALPGQSARDIGSVLIAQILMIVPFLLARQFLSTETGLREMLLALMVGGLIYSIPSLIEIRFSPQMNVWVYGFFQHSFEQMIRGDGFRPIVFLPHGLWLAFFVLTTIVAAAALARVGGRAHWRRNFAIVGYLTVLLVLCKSAASLLYGLLLLPVTLFLSTRWQLRLAMVFALIAVSYPMLRNLNVIPLDTVVERAAAISPERAHSLEYRFINEEQMLARAAERPLYGWGGWGRNLVRHSETGEIESIPDGRWIIVFGTFGWVGYLCEFGLLALPLMLMGMISFRRSVALSSPLIGPVALILGITMIDMLLNATLTPLTWLAAGAVLGYAERLMARHRTGSRYILSEKPVMSG